MAILHGKTFGPKPVIYFPEVLHGAYFNRRHLKMSVEQKRSVSLDMWVIFDKTTKAQNRWKLVFWRFSPLNLAYNFQKRTYQVPSTIPSPRGRSHRQFLHTELPWTHRYSFHIFAWWYEDQLFLRRLKFASEYIFQCEITSQGNLPWNSKWPKNPQISLE